MVEMLNLLFPMLCIHDTIPFETALSMSWLNNYDSYKTESKYVSILYCTNETTRQQNYCKGREAR